MRYINLFLVLTMILCYGLGGRVNHPCAFTETTNSYTDRQSETSGTDILAKSYISADTAGQGESVCHYALLNASNDYDLSLFLGSIVANKPNLETNQAFSFSSSIKTNKKYRPPDLFITNSSLLL